MSRVVMILITSLFLMGCSAFNGSSQYASNKPVHQMHHNEDTVGRSEFPEQRAATGKKVFIFDPRHKAWAAYDANGERIKTGRASGGKAFCADLGKPCRTVTGRFAVYNKRGADCVSKKFPIGEGGAPMPHCMFFRGGYAIHGSYHVPRYNASHGCIRVLPSAAKWLSDDFMGYGTTVVVKPY